ncbi:restriction endonuclease subunit S [Segatella copri]|uniref:restriction endonuclease subunit S n=1 Tax=Segatella copri TaxID=165179 RepID=UPI001D176CE4|nr:restriction endonuclease subunit S [Segatella copri]
MRFPKFYGEWCVSTIGEQFDLYSGNTPSRLNKEHFDGNVNWITSGELKEHYISDTKEKISEDAATANNLKLLHPGTFVIAIYGLEADGVRGTGSITCKESTISQACMAFTQKGDVKNEFLYSWYKKHGNIIGIKYAQGTKQQNLSYDILEKFHIAYPSQDEQDKLIQFISLLDERIATQSKLIEDLKKLKSAIVEKVFCSPNQEYPMCRIEGFEQALSTYKMSDFSSRIATKNKDSKCSLVLTIAAQYGLVNQESFFNKSVASENLTGYYLLHKGEFAYNRSYSAGYDWGTVKRLDNYDEGVLSTLYICFKTNETIVDSDYLAYYFESTKWHRGLSDIAGEGARNHGLLNVSMADYFNTKHRFPVIEEQKTIAKILNAITEKERKATMLGECYQKQKQYLLCQMFT